MDDEAGHDAGYPGAFGMGNLQLAYLHLLLRECLAVSGGRIVTWTAVPPHNRAAPHVTRRAWSRGAPRGR